VTSVEPPLMIAKPEPEAVAPPAAPAPGPDFGWLPAESGGSKADDDDRLDEFFKSLQ